ncbi:MAG: helix-turn-helix transcriptional regulator [Sphingosinicella sp.]|nr:helix-turn-helix transcriptional regulator [Sphingosinicella sp.]
MEMRQTDFGEQLRGWRQLRRMSQLDLALEADISTRHLSFIETGRSRPSREIVLRVAEQLDIPLRSRNLLLLAAGLAPAYPERSLDEPALDQARKAIDMILKGHEPFPALAVDRHWNMIAANGALGAFLEGVSPDLLQPPVNVLRLSLHPEGVAPRILNLGEWKAHLIDRLRGQYEASADPALGALCDELEEYPAPPARASTEYAGILVPLMLDMGGRRLSFFSTTTIFGTPVEVTLSEIAIEAFFPADPETAETLSGDWPKNNGADARAGKLRPPLSWNVGRP